MSRIFLTTLKASPQILSRFAPLTHLETLYLFVASDLKTTVLPATIFALVATFSGSLLTNYTPPVLPLSLSQFTINILKSLLWTILSLLLFNLSNQRLPNSILEDTLNKPYRPLPSHRITPTTARRLLLCLLSINILLAHFLLGARNELLFLIALTWAYNDLAGGDEHFLVRHILNALGFCTFGAGAAAVCVGSGRGLNSTAYLWLLFIGIVITCTIQFQDMEDQEGDSLRDRKTMPLVIGDAKTRKINAIAIVLFSIAAPVFWGKLSWGWFVGLGGLGGAIAWRCLVGEYGVKRDKATFRLWCVWLVVLYLLPLGRVEW